MNKYIAQLAELDWAKVAGIGIALAVVYYFMMFDSGTAIEQNIKAAQDEVAASKTKLSQTEKAIEDANRFEREVQATSRQFEKIVEFMPPQMGAAEMTAIINKQAQASGLTPRISPKGAEKIVDFYQPVKVDVQLDGSFSQILTFLSNISRVPKLLTFDKVSLKLPPSGGNLLTFSGSLYGYRYIAEAGDPKTPAKPGAAPAAGAPK